MLEALLWGFHNARSGLCFPSLERIAEAAGCARGVSSGSGTVSTSANSGHDPRFNESGRG